MPRDLRIRPIAAVVMPLPTELTTPPVTNMYLLANDPPSSGGSFYRPKVNDTARYQLDVKEYVTLHENCVRWQDLKGMAPYTRVCLEDVTVCPLLGKLEN